MSKQITVFIAVLGVALLAGCSSLPQPKGPITHVNPEHYYQDDPVKGHQVKVPAEEVEAVDGQKSNRIGERLK